jgi:hypothetical protein
MKNQSQYRLMLCGGAVAALTGFMGFTQSALAASIVMQGAVNAQAPTFGPLGLGELNNLGNITSASRMIDKNGLNVQYTNGQDQKAYLDSNPKHWDGISQEWFSRPNRIDGLSSWLTFDLGATYNLRNLVLWNEDFAGIRDFEVYTANTIGSGGFYTDTVFRNAFMANDVPVNPNFNAPPDYIEPHQLFTLSATDIQARYVALFINSVYINDVPNRDHLPGQAGLGHFAAIGEVAFGVDAIPTPALLPGLVGLGVSAWRKKRKATAV